MTVRMKVSSGQRMLCQVPFSAAQVGARVGVSKQSVSYWRLGRKVPSPEAREKLFDLYGIAPTAWVRPYDKPSAAKPASKPLAPGQVVYLACNAGRTRLKIGKTKDLAVRKKALRTYGFVEVVWTIPGAHAEEQALLSQFEAHREEGSRETFSYPPIASAVRELIEGSVVAQFGEGLRAIGLGLGLQRAS